MIDNLFTSQSILVTHLPLPLPLIPFRLVFFFHLHSDKSKSENFNSDVKIAFVALDLIQVKILVTYNSDYSFGRQGRVYYL